MRQDLRLNAAPAQPSPFPERSNLLSQPLARFPALRLSLTLLVCLLAVVIVLPADGAKADAKRDAAKNQFEKAERQRIALQGKPQNQRTIEEYTQLVAAFRRVYLITPHATQVPQALLAVAELYQEMGRRFDAKYYQSAVDAYQFLLHEYPESRHKQDALLTIARIQKDDLEQYDQETADYLIDTLYRHYHRICFVAFSDAELEHYRPRALEVAQFCQQRWGMVYEEVRGSDKLVNEFLSMPGRLDQGNEEFVVVPPGGEVSEGMFHRPDEGGSVSANVRGR